MDKTDRSFNNIKELIDFIRDFEAAKNGKKSLNLEGISLEDFKKDISFTFNERLAQKNLTIDYKDSLPKDCQFFLVKYAESLKTSLH